MITLLLATTNHHKTTEFQHMLSHRAKLHNLHDLGQNLQIHESGSTFTENAILKAVAAAQNNGIPALADDSGLSVDSLQGAPGVHSARYAGENATDAENRQKLLSVLNKLGLNSPHLRKAHFHCTLALASPNGLIATWNGSVSGHIAPNETGTSGFGYDPIFIPNGHTRSFAEMPPNEKHQLSHRSIAINHFLHSWDSGEIPQITPS